MKALVLTKHGPPEVLQVRDWPAPQPGPGQVLVRVHAAGLNFAEVMARMGLYPPAPKPPCVLGYEVAGVVEAVGAGVERPAVGERVAAATRFGGWAEYAVAGAPDTVPVPAGLSFEQAAAIPVNYATAYAALVPGAGLRPGERVLIHAAAGGVGIAATQIAKHLGAEVFGSASPGKREALLAQGVDHPIDRTAATPVAQQVRAITGGEGLDVVLDALGGSSFGRSYRLLRGGGRLVIYGASTIVGGERRNLVRALRGLLAMRPFKPVRLMRDNKAVIGLELLGLWDERGSLEGLVEPLVGLLEAGVIRPQVAAAFPFERAAEAHRMIGERRNVGKVVLVP